MEFGAHAFGQSIGGAPGVAGYSGVDFSGLSNEWRYVLLPRAGAWSVQATVTATPQWARVFEGGAHGQDFTLPLLFILEAQPIERRLYADLNLTYAPEVSRITGQPVDRGYDADRERRALLSLHPGGDARRGNGFL